ncbi:MAG TPA: GNAT family N-acetyltransferase [Ktedonobacteraceae bacterium]|jgi:predicted acetyltransferase|nr:GNAT family N-acetyltransferase [Ktedonobacteraceae bacterium]
MQQEDLALVKPTVALEKEYVAMVREFMETDEAWFTNFPLALENFAEFVRELEEEEQGVGLPPGVVPQQTYWLVKDGVNVLGEIRLRPRLTEPFEQHNGHIGYNIRPSQRGRGYATRQLALVLDKAREQGLTRVMLTIDGENPSSVRVIEKNAGKLAWQRLAPESGETLSCYWIDLI